MNSSKKLSCRANQKDISGVQRIQSMLNKEDLRGKVGDVGMDKDEGQHGQKLISAHSFPLRGQKK